MTAPEPLKENALNHSWDVAERPRLGRFLGRHAGRPRLFRDAHTTPLYSEIFFNRLYRFQYPPSALFALKGLQRLAPDNVRTDENQTFRRRDPQRHHRLDLSFWRPALPRRHCSSCRSASDTRRIPAVLVAARVAIAAGFTLTFYPIVKAYTLGQLQVWINGLFAVALLCWVIGLQGRLRLPDRADLPDEAAVRPVPAMGAAAARNGASCAVCAATVAVGLGASVLVFGLANHIDYLRVISFLSSAARPTIPITPSTACSTAS